MVVKDGLVTRTPEGVSVQRRLFMGLAACALALTMMSQAAADIASFNAAVKANDYAKAAAEAAATWPTLDKSRADIGEIAREFGFAALVARDYSAAQSYAKFAAEHETGDLQLVAIVLQRLAEYRAGPTDQTRSSLLEAMTKRAERPGFDAISLAAANSLIDANVATQRWVDLRRGAEAAAKMAKDGGPPLLAELRRFELFSKTAAYFEQERMEGFVPIRDHKALIGHDIESASEEEAKQLVSVYWQAEVWRSVVAIRLGAQKKWRDDVAEKGAMLLTPEAFPRLAKLTNMEPTGCKIMPARQPLDMVRSSRKHAGAVVLQFDIDSRGHASNPSVLAAYPEDSPFIQAYLGSVDRWTYKPGRQWDAKTCSLARSKHTITLTFAHM